MRHLDILLAFSSQFNFFLETFKSLWILQILLVALFSKIVAKNSRARCFVIVVLFLLVVLFDFLDMGKVNKTTCMFLVESYIQCCYCRIAG